MKAHRAAALALLALLVFSGSLGSADAKKKAKRASKKAAKAADGADYVIAGAFFLFFFIRFRKQREPSRKQASAFEIKWPPLSRARSDGLASSYLLVPCARDRRRPCPIDRRGEEEIS